MDPEEFHKREISYIKDQENVRPLFFARLQPERPLTLLSSSPRSIGRAGGG